MALILCMTIFLGHNLWLQISGRSAKRNHLLQETVARPRDATATPNRCGVLAEVAGIAGKC
jgi:hypothetical protein